MNTADYVTVSNVRENGLWETFELNHSEEFASFNHEEGKPLEGRGYFIEQDDVNIMVEEINKHIQKYRQHIHSEQVEEAWSVNIVSTESAAGTLKVGLERPRTVIGFPDFLSIGPLWKLEEKIGQTYREEWLNDNINFEYDDYEYRNKFENTLREIEDIPNHVPIYIWYGNNAAEQTGLRFFLYLMRNKSNKINLINSTELEDQNAIHTGQISPENIRKLFEKNNEKQPLTQDERIQFQREWETLSQTKEVLRIWSDNKMKAVPDYHYDPVIINTLEKLHNQQIKKDFIKTATVIGEMMDKIDDYFYLEYRIRHLIYSGVLELKGIPKSIRHYSVKIR
ncbi:DUF1835 domain-containing protein [Fredinandcohnia quinoae]|uniref:DUF1835 domain-containing protein n=1 Tax=Fredinandcohnia quinoae TaxID=2918902 RepID=A0AAW5DVJ6_9BACI|nr:DUF1835 domain-containing protein [Fredinandcohnia sp. SECRCQ15]MCH1624368.1 DUF1835 domain-containing protein [Fredinandcohnia sp. SECRCQ15]